MQRPGIAVERDGPAGHTGLRGRLRSWVPYVLVILLALLTGSALERFSKNTALKRQQEANSDYVEDTIARAQLRLSHYVDLTDSLLAYLSLNRASEAADFDAMAGVVTRGNSSIINVALARDYVVTHVYPLEPNLSALGLDYRTRPDQIASIEKVLADRETTVVGPVRLVQGGTGLIVRAAGAGSDRMLLSVVLGLDPFLAEIGLGGTWGQSDVAVRATINGTDESVTIFGSDQVWQASPIVRSLRLNETDVLDIGIAPVGGWISRSPFLWQIGALVFGLLTIALYGVQFATRLIRDRSEARRQLVVAINSSQDAFVIYDREDRLTLCNEKYKLFYPESADLFVPGARFEDIIRKGVARGQYPAAAGREEEWIRERLAAHANPAEPIEQEMPDGRWLRVTESKTPDGYTVGFRVDITELKTAILRAEAASRARTDFLNNISHEFRTPLTIVLGYIAFLKNVRVLPRFRDLSDAVGEAQPAREKLDAFTEDIITQAGKTDRSGRQLMALINSVLDWSTISGGHVELVLSDIDLDALLRGLCEEFHDAARTKGLAFGYEGTPCHVEGDEVRLRQVFMNLISNAIKFTDKGYVNVTLERSDRDAVVHVEDTGVGIPPDQRETVFERFAQVDMSSKRKYGGAGLGLAICKGLLDLHRGNISLQSTFGAGSRFTVRLPMTRPGKDASPGPGSPGSAA
ncbi:MAG: hypothetical protein EP307_11175 [Rhodobacteraceae bacterium]|nr:MAG: hypothetical protein EP307_11175 [Paracoccaceae bacterium]